MDEADPYLPVIGWSLEDDHDKPTTSSIVEREEFPEDFEKYRHRNLNWSRLEDDDGESHVSGWVFWSRQDDRPNRPSVSDFVSENMNIIPDSIPKVKDRIRLALGRIALHPRCRRSLIQYWAATKIEGRTLLTTQNQPFALSKAGSSTWGLCEYRMKSMEYKFYGDIGGGGEEELGLPGRVYLHKLPESTPDVQYYSLKEYPQRDDASRCQVRASWALPVFEPSSQICVGVLELVSAVDAMTDWYDKSFLRNLNGVFQELGLQCIDSCKHYEMKNNDDDKALMTAFHKLMLVLEPVYKIHKLPLALTWIKCSACDGLTLGQSLFEVGEYLGALEAKDNHVADFLTGSTGYLLRKGQVAERVLSSHNMLYCSDIKQFSIAEYPLVPFARQCKLSGWFTMCLHSIYTGEDDYVLELFLPANKNNNENTLATVRMILGTMKANFKTFKLAYGEELGELLSVKVFDFKDGQRHQYVQRIQASLELDVISAEQDDSVVTISEGGTTKTQERKYKQTGVRFDICLEDVLRFSSLSRRDAARELKVSESTLKRVCRRYGINRWPPLNINKGEASLASLQNVGDILHLDSLEEPPLIEVDDTITGPQYVGTDILKQLFGSKRKDAAQHLGVSVSTLKRICRQHGINRWPNQQVGALKPLQNGEGPRVPLNSTDQPSMDAVHNLRSFNNAKQNISEGPRVPLDSTDQPSMDAVHNLRSFNNAKQNISEGPRVPLDSTDQPSMDAVRNLRSSNNAKQNISDVTCPGEGTIKMQEREQRKTGVRIQISLEDILKCSGMRLDDAANRLMVSSSTLKRICREYNIHRWPPRNINKINYPQPLHVEHQRGISQLASDMPPNQASDGKNTGTNQWPPHDTSKVGSPRPLGVEHQGGISQLTSDLPINQASDGKDNCINRSPPHNINKVGSPRPSHVEHEGETSQLTHDTPSNQVSAGGVHIKPHDTTFQETKTVTIRAKYLDCYTLKFKLSMPWRLVDLHHQVAKRLNLEAGTYYVTYKDDEDELILIACDEDLEDFINTCRSLRKNILVELAPK